MITLTEIIEQVKKKIKLSDKELYSYAKVMHKRIPKIEQRILKHEDAALAYQYAKDIIKDRWLEAEPIIMKSPTVAYSYAKNVIKSRWKEAEPIIMQDLKLIRSYADDVIRGRWPEAEEYIEREFAGYVSKIYEKKSVNLDEYMAKFHIPKDFKEAFDRNNNGKVTSEETKSGEILDILLDPIKRRKGGFEETRNIKVEFERYITDEFIVFWIKMLKPTIDKPTFWLIKPI